MEPTTWASMTTYRSCKVTAFKEARVSQGMPNLYRRVFAKQEPQDGSCCLDLVQGFDFQSIQPHTVSESYEYQPLAQAIKWRCSISKRIELEPQRSEPQRTYES